MVKFWFIHRVKRHSHITNSRKWPRPDSLYIQRKMQVERPCPQIKKTQVKSDVSLKERGDWGDSLRIPVQQKQGDKHKEPAISCSNNQDTPLETSFRNLSPFIQWNVDWEEYSSRWWQLLLIFKIHLGKPEPSLDWPRAISGVIFLIAVGCRGAQAISHATARQVSRGCMQEIAEQCRETSQLAFLHGLFSSYLKVSVLA